jgi:hypothetical protein
MARTVLGRGLKNTGLVRLVSRGSKRRNLNIHLQTYLFCTLSWMFMLHVAALDVAAKEHKTHKKHPSPLYPLFLPPSEKNTLCKSVSQHQYTARDTPQLRKNFIHTTTYYKIQTTYHYKKTFCCR